MAQNRSHKTISTESSPPAEDLSAFLACLPPDICQALENQTGALYEVVLDLGRLPEARYLDHQCVYLSESPVTEAQLEHTIERVGSFTGDNRAGIERPLHRISAMRN